MNDQARILTPSNMHAAIDPDGREVWCDFAERIAMTNDGFCQYCGSTDHEPPSKPCPDTCPVCWLDLKRDGYPHTHQHSATGDQCEFRWE